jgi:hypothetical protein
MNNHKLALVSVFTSIELGASFIPVLGVGVSLYVSLAIWASCGFKYWLMSLPVMIVFDFVSIIQIPLIVGQTAIPVARVIATSGAQTQTGFNIVSLIVLVMYPAILYFAKSGVRKMLVKRIGESRLP